MANIIYEAMASELKAPLIASIAANDFTWPVMWPNMPTSSVNTSSAFTALAIITDAPEGAELGLGAEVLQGIMQLNIYTPANTGDKLSNEISDVLRGVYPRGRLSNCVQILKSGVTSQGNEDINGAKMVATYTIEFDYYTI